MTSTHFTLHTLHRPTHTQIIIRLEGFPTYLSAPLHYLQLSTVQYLCCTVSCFYCIRIRFKHCFRMYYCIITILILFGHSTIHHSIFLPKVPFALRCVRTIVFFYTHTHTHIVVGLLLFLPVQCLRAVKDRRPECNNSCNGRTNRPGEFWIVANPACHK